MESFRELPVKTIPKILLLDLRHRYIWVPQEIQMLIMFYKETAETRNKMTDIVIKFTSLMYFPNAVDFCCHNIWVLERKWKQVVVQTNPHQLQGACQHCSQYYEHLLSADIMDRLFNACAARAIMMYRKNTIELKVGHWMCITGGTPAHVNSLQKILNFFGDQSVVYFKSVLSTRTSRVTRITYANGRIKHKVVLRLLFNEPLSKRCGNNVWKGLF